MVESLKSYANTSVSPGRTKEQIEGLLRRVGAIGFRWDSGLPVPQASGFAGARVYALHACS